MILHSKKIGFPLKSFNLITRAYPRLKISSFPILTKALAGLDENHIIGTWVPRIEVMVSADGMMAQLFINTTKDEFEENRKSILEQAELVLHETGVSYGRIPIKNNEYTPGEPIIAALGSTPQKGVDAEITYIVIPERKPVIQEDGSANHYEMNFVTQVKQGDWLGEKIPSQAGIDGSDVYGNRVPAVAGDDVRLVYDRKSVIEEQELDKIVLRAAHDGALVYKEGVLSVVKHLVINGDVGPETGSITFEGAVTIYGTVLAGYSVVASGDIAVEGSEGITNAKMLQSKEGDIYIKGGIFGGNTTIVEAQGDIFIKHANNCKLYGEDIHVGLYLLGTDIIATNVFVDKHAGKIIGGRIEVVVSIESAIAGNSHERMTNLCAKGTDKDALYLEIQEMAKELKERQNVVEKLEQHTSQFDKDAVGGTSQQEEAYAKIMETIEISNEMIMELDRDIQLKLMEIKSAKPPQIEVTKEAYPGTIIQIGSRSTTLQQTARGLFRIVDDVLNV